MQVTKLTAEQINAAPKKHQYTMEEMQREYDYIRAEQMTKKLLDKGLITEEEYDIIMKKTDRYSPLFCQIYIPDNRCYYRGSEVICDLPKRR